MYHPQTILNNLEIVHRTGGPPTDNYPNGSPLPFQLTYYSKDYIRTCVSHLESLINKDLWLEKGRLEYKRALAPDEIQFIQNEQFLCTFDYLYFARNYAFILYWNYKGLDLFEPNKAQLIINSVRAEMEFKGVGIWIIQLKSRQVGASTDDQVAGAHRVLFHPNTRGITVSSKEDKTRQLVNKLGTVVNNCPFYLLPTVSKQNVDKKTIEIVSDFKIYESGEVYYESLGMNCQMRVQYGNQTGGVGRGETPDWAHLTEIPDWLNPKEDIQNSLVKSMHNDPRFFLVLESTGKYKGDYFNEIWDDSCEYYFKGQSRFYPLYLGWYIADDIYPTKADVRAFMPIDYKPTERAEGIAKQVEAYVRTSDLLKKHMDNKETGEPWKMTLAQKWFYEWDRQQAERENRLSTWLCEMTSTPEQSFAVRGSGMFDAEFIESLREKAKPIEFVFGISSSNYTINFKHRFNSSLTDSSLLTVTVESRWSTNLLYNYSFKLTPLHPANYASKALAGLLLVWELPDDDEEYEVAVDCGEGIGQDYTDVKVIAKGDYRAGTKDRFVASFYSNQISATELVPFLLAIASFYVYQRNNQVKQPKLVIERPKGGTVLIQECVKSGYKNFFVNRTIANRQMEDPSKKLGWEPTQQLRDDMLSEFLQAIKDDDIEINCSFMIDCLATFGWNPTRRKMEALAGHHDDPIMSGGMAFYSINTFDLKGRDPGAEHRRQQKRLAELANSRKYIYEPGEMAKPVAARSNYSYWDKFNQ